MEMVQIAGIALIGAFLAMILKEQKPNMAFLLTMFVGSSIFLFMLGKVSEIIHVVMQLANESNVNYVYLTTILKIIGIAYIAEYAAQITKDAGQNALASKIEMAGKIIILSIALPIVTSIITSVVAIIK